MVDVEFSTSLHALDTTLSCPYSFLVQSINMENSLGTGKCTTNLSKICAFAETDAVLGGFISSGLGWSMK